MLVSEFNDMHYGKDNASTPLLAMYYHISYVLPYSHVIRHTTPFLLSTGFLPVITTRC